MSSILMHGDWPLDMLAKHVWHGCVQGTLALVLVYAVCRLFPRISPHAASWLWRLGYLKLLVAFVCLGSICVPVLHDSYSRHTSTSIGVVPAGKQMHTLAASVGWVAGSQDVVLVVMTLWCIGIILFGIRIGTASRRTRALRQACSEVEDSDLQTELADLCLRMGIRRAPQLLAGDVSSPLICGFVCPSIILPNWTLADSSREELRLMLAHELAHMKRCDILWAWLPMLAQWFFFFNPIVWLMRREWLFAQEAACDALAIEATSVSQADYGRMLLGHVVQAKASGRLVAAGIVEPYETLKRRLNAMVDSGTGTRKKQITVGIVICLVAVVGVIPWAVGRVNRNRASSEMASTLVGAVYSQDMNAFRKVFPTAAPTNLASAGLSQKIQAFGPVKSVVLETEGKIVPGPTGMGFTGGPDPKSGRKASEISTWKVTTERGEYRLGLRARDGVVMFYVFNLGNEGIGSGYW